MDTIRDDESNRATLGVIKINSRLDIHLTSLLLYPNLQVDQ